MNKINAQHGKMLLNRTDLVLMTNNRLGRLLMMKYRIPISILVILIAMLSFTASAIGVFSSGGKGPFEYTSFRGETITVHGRGIYQDDSVAVAAQGIAQDVVTMVLGVPLLLFSLRWARQGSLKGRLLLTGTLGYFLYTYVSYAFLWMYNPLFLVFVALMSASFFAFLLCMMSFDISSISSYFDPKTPVKFLGGFQIFFAVAIGMLWLGKIIPSLLSGGVPAGLEHYTTLVIQAMDLGFIVPVAITSGVLLLMRRPFGYLLSSVVIMKGFTMGAALSAMIIGQALAGVHMTLTEVIMFPAVSLVIAYCLVLILKSIHEKGVPPIARHGKLTYRR
jgi:hypothetical protein